MRANLSRSARPRTTLEALTFDAVDVCATVPKPPHCKHLMSSQYGYREYRFGKTLPRGP
jgi:hypothetical protein